LGLAAIWPIAIIEIYDGVRSGRSVGFTRKPALRVASGAFFCLVFGLVAIAHAYVSMKQLEILKPYVSEKLAQVSTQSLPVPDHDKFNRLRAKSAYWELGEIQTYLDATGISKTYAPSQEEVSDREKFVVVRAKLKEDTPMYLILAILIWLSALVAAVYGWRQAHHAAA
jgi:hypothetical protein